MIPDQIAHFLHQIQLPEPHSHKGQNGKLLIIGGHDNVNSANLADTWCTGDGKNWRPVVSETCWTPRHEPTVYVFDGSLWVVGGNTWPLMNDVWRLALVR